MGHNDRCPNVKAAESIRDRTNVAIGGRPLFARVVRMFPAFVLFGIVTIVATADPASAQWCSMPVLGQYTGYAGTFIRGVPILVGCASFAFAALYGGGGNYFGVVVACVIGIVCFGIGFGLPQIVTWGAPQGGSLAAMDMQCLFGGG